MTTNAWRRSFGLLLPLGLLLSVFCLPASAAGSRHPYFNDRGTLSWHHSLASAQRAARRLNKVIFIEYGRKKCTNCRKLAQNVLPHRSLRSRMSDAAVGLAAECDRPERAVYQLFKAHLPGARVLPFAAFVTPDGRWITGWYGAKSVRQVAAHLAFAEGHVRAMRRTVVHRTAAPQPAPPARRAAPRPTARRAYPAPPPPASVLRENGIRPSPQPAPAAPVDVPEEDVDDGCDDPCAGGACVGPNCKPPSFECKPLIDLPRLPNPFELLTKNCKPKACPPCPPKPVCPPQPAPAVAAKTNGFGDFPPPQPRVKGPERHLAEVDSPDGPTPVPPPARPANDKVPVIPAAAAAAAGVKPGLPAPVVKKTVPGIALPPTAQGPTGRFPDSKIPSCDPTPSVADRAKAAAERGDWAAVLLLTRRATPQQTYLVALNREAHAWAHSRLAYAVAEVRKGRFVEARKAVAEVKLAMRGEAESIDAERGVEAIELMRDLDFLAEKSPVRTTVRKTAYEKMRGTRWAALFSDGAQPSVALSSR